MNNFFSNFIQISIVHIRFIKRQRHQKLLLHKKICWNDWSVSVLLCLPFKFIEYYSSVSECFNYYILKGSVSIEYKFCSKRILSQHLSDVQRILTYEPRNCAHSCQAFKLSLTVSLAHRIITISTWALESPSGGHFQHFHRHAQFCFPFFSFEKKPLHSSSKCILAVSSFSRNQFGLISRIQKYYVRKIK